MTMTDTPTPADAAVPDGAEATDAFVEKLFGSLLGALEVQAAYIGDRLGWYQVLDGEPLTSTELARSTDTDERYAREWLEHQTVSGYITCVDPAADPLERRYHLPVGHAPVLARPDDLAHILPFARFVGGVGKHIETIVDAYRTGEGVGWSVLGKDARESQAGMNRPMFVHQLGHEYLRSVPDIDAALRRGGRVADIGAGGGWSSIGVASAYPHVTVDAFDLDAPSVELARTNIEEAGLADRVRVHCADAGSLDTGGTYDLVMALECIHDMPDPVSVLSTMGRLAGDDGVVLVMDERVGDTFDGVGDDVERLFYGCSLMCCLPDGRAHDHSVATGTVMRRSTFEGYALDAGFTAVDVLPIDNDFFRFYRLR